MSNRAIQAPQEPMERLIVCLECGADNFLSAERCWMCQADLKHAPAVKPAGYAAARPQWSENESSGLIMTAALGALVLIVGAGIYASEPGLLIPYAIIAVPALLATIIRVTRKRGQGKPVGFAEALGTFFLSGVAILGLLFLIAIAAIVGLILYCFAALSGLPR